MLMNKKYLKYIEKHKMIEMTANLLNSSFWKIIRDLKRTIKEMVPRDGIEPSTRGFSVLCSTD